MANEFIVRKGLVVEGASSGTVVNVLGSLGQLFSVTDNLTGSIFSVSDISGVPIFDVNSDGNTGIGTSSSTAKLFVNSTSDGEKIRWGRNNALVGSVGTYNGVPYIGYQGGAGGGIMFNGASIEPTGLGSARQNNSNDIGSTTYRWKNGWFGSQLISNTMGIGTSTPQTKLDVKLANNTTASIGGTISVGSFAGLSFGYSESNNSNYRHSAIVFERDDAAFGDARGKIHLLNSPSGSTSADLGDSRLTILPTGYVGIDNTSPDKLLHVGDGSAQIGSPQGAEIEGYNNTLDLKTNEANSIADFTAALNLFCDGVVGSSGTGTGIYFRAKTGGGGGGEYTKGRIQGAVYTSWTTNTDATRTSKLVIQTTNSGTHADRVTILGTGATTFVSTVTATNFILSSDETLKDNIKNIDNKHIGVDWKNFELKSEPGIKRYGVIAQELEEKHPEFVRTDKEGLKSVAYIDLLIAKIAELEARLEKAGL